MYVTYFLYSLVPIGYYVILNATQYEFDVECGSPAGTVVFRSWIFLENETDTTFVSARFVGEMASHFLVNGLSQFSLEDNISNVIPLTITLAEPLNCSSEMPVWRDLLQATAFDLEGNSCEDISDIIIYKRSAGNTF